MDYYDYITSRVSKERFICTYRLRFWNYDLEVWTYQFPYWNELILLVNKGLVRLEWRSTKECSLSIHVIACTPREIASRNDIRLHI